MTDLRKAAEQALEALCTCGQQQKEAKEALRQALAQSEQEPVAWADKVGAVIPHSHKLFQPDLLKDYTRPLYTAPVDAVNISEERVDETVKREHEPVAWVIEDGEVDYYVDVVAKIKPGTPLYTAPPKKEWIGLTRDEVLDIEETTKHPLGFYQVIEAKLKEKNHG